MNYLLSNQTARMFGTCFVLSFLSYGIGSHLVNEFLGINTELYDLVSKQHELVFAIILISIVHTLSNAALPILMYSYFSQFDLILSKAYLILGVIATLILACSSYPVYELWQYLNNNDPLFSLREFQHATSVAFNQLYFVSMLVWAFAGGCFSRLAGISGLLPNGISITGIVFYSVFGSYAFVNALQIPSSSLLMIPAAIFEITLSVYLLFVYSEQGKGLLNQKSFEVKEG